MAHTQLYYIIIIIDLLFRINLCAIQTLIYNNITLLTIQRSGFVRVYSLHTLIYNSTMKHVVTITTGNSTTHYTISIEQMRVLIPPNIL